MIVFAVVLFTNTGNATNQGDLNLNKVMSLNEADAECIDSPWQTNFWFCNAFGRCAYNYPGTTGCVG